MKPGDRRNRWKQATGIGFVLFALLAALALILIEGYGRWLVASFFALLALLEVRDYQRGWLIRYDLPPWGQRDIKRNDLIGEVAREAWEATQREARDPNRQRYAFRRRSPKP